MQTTQPNELSSPEPEPPNSSGASTATQPSPGGSGGLSLRSATALVIGSIVGTGVFTMPAVLATAGTCSLLVLAVVALGAMVLAVLFGQLTARVPNSDGGLYAYSRYQFGMLPGYTVGWSYWLSSWAGNAAIVSSWVFYVVSLFGWRSTRWTDFAIAVVGLWVPAALNLAGLRQMAWFQNVTVVIKFVPLLFVGIVGWAFVKSANFGPFNASGKSLWYAIGLAAGVALFSFIGVETAAMTAKRVRNPRRNVGRASIYGTGSAAILYLLCSAAVMGLVPHGTLVKTGSPFVNAFQSMFSTGGSWPGKLIAAVAVVSGIGALNGWTLTVTETSRAMADQGMFPRAFSFADRNDTAWFGILVGTALPTLLMLWSYSSKTGLTVFTYLVDLSVVTTSIPYFFSALAQVTYLVTGREVDRRRLRRDMTIGLVGCLFSMWVIFAGGYQAVYQGLVVILAGMLLYPWLPARRRLAAERAGGATSGGGGATSDPALDGAS
jgi:APA family basic amino acid/polyamine antiporter